MATVQTSTSTTADETNAQLLTLSQKYLGNKEYVLSGTANGYIGAEVTPLAPYTNLTNRYYPTVATIPQVSSNILVVILCTSSLVRSQVCRCLGMV